MKRAKKVDAQWLREKGYITEKEEKAMSEEKGDLAQMEYDDDVRDLPLNCRNVIQGLVNRLALRRTRIEKASDVHDFFMKNEITDVTDPAILILIARNAQMSLTDVQRVYEQGRSLRQNQ